MNTPNTSDIRSDILKGMCDILWGSAWADHVENHGCYNLCGCDICECMPEIPDIVKESVAKLIVGIEKANGCTIEELYRRASAANELEHNFPEPKYSSPERFGDCLAHMTMGSGVSWFDDNIKFDLQVPYEECSDIKLYADEHCKEEGEQVQCSECGEWVDAETAHLHQGNYIGDQCCWDERLRTTE